MIACLLCQVRSSLKLAKWSYHADEGDLKAGLKSAHRNELLFALASLVNAVESDPNQAGVNLTKTRYILSLSQGLFRVKQSKVGGSGRVRANFSTVDRKLYTDEPEQIAKALIGKVRPGNLLSFKQVYQAIMSDDFDHPELREAVLHKAYEGIVKKGLTIPKQLLPFK
jgi:hypothetical protein